MTVREVIELLSTFPEDSIVILSSDAEGSNYSPLADVSECLYVEETTWSGFVLDEDDEEFEALENDAVKAVGFWPTN